GGLLLMRADYEYDVFGNRVAKTVDADGSGPETATTTNFAYDVWWGAVAPGSATPWDVWAELDGSGTPTRYLRGDTVNQVLARQDGGGTFWYVTDRQGSVRALADAGGVVQDRLSYDSFGGVSGESNVAVGGRYKYTGREQDSETGLQFNRHRYY